jgi:glyoxylase-like metal-dependent hydrolase (beta-lactamase superfamily II)/ferredoxin
LGDLVLPAYILFMALPRLRRAENVPGDFFVDSSCIDCDQCRQIAPESFSRIGEQAAVYSQPSDRKMEIAALKALVTCPTASIGALGHHPVEDAVHAFPDLIQDDVYFCGYASESSFGASSYLIVRSQGNVLVDSPRFAKPLVKNIEMLGGVRFIFLTHKDDVADHEQWARHFGASRFIHTNDAGRLIGKIEHLIKGSNDVLFDEDLRIIPTPGHTRGHLAFLYRDQFLFTGDHLWWSPRYHSLHASRDVCWYSWPEQIQSVKRLQDYRFEWVLPGHGLRVHAPSEQMQEYLQECVRRIDSRGLKSAIHNAG